VGNNETNAFTMGCAEMTDHRDVFAGIAKYERAQTAAKHAYFPFAEWPAESGSIRPRIICLPWAGGVASAYRSWIPELRDIAQVLATELPGHGVRFGEPCIDDATVLAARIAKAVLALPRAEAPVLIYGHSMGAILGFETARLLAQRSTRLLGLVLSGHHAPHWPHRRSPRSNMTDRMLADDLRDKGGTAPEILNSPDLLSVIFPTLRADYRLTETYRPALHMLMPKLSLPVDIIGGQADADNPPEGLEAWRDVICGPLEISLWPGGHFFIDDRRKALLAHLRQRVSKWSTAAAETSLGDSPSNGR